MSDKSELEYLEEAMSGMAYANLNDIRRAIERRKQDLAKADAALLYTNREKLYMDTPQNVPNTADNTPKGGGDGEYFAVTSAGSLDRVFKPFTTDRPKVVRASAFDALLAELDALRERIAQLEGALHEIQFGELQCDYCQENMRIARAALAGSTKEPTDE